MFQRNRRRQIVLLVSTLLVLLLAACAPPAPAPAAAPAAEQAAAPAADTSGGDLVEASKNEKEGLLIYSIMSEKNWAPVIAGFNAKYPWIQVTTTDLGAYEVFERYYTESAGNARTGDFIATAAPDGWINFLNKGEVLDYVSTEDANVPDFAKIGQGVYAVSTDPMVMIWNKQLVAEPPATMADLVAAIGKDTAAYDGKLVSYDADGEGFGYGLNYYYTQARGDEGWKNLETLGSTNVKILTSGGKMIDAVLAGESSIGYFVSLITVKPRLADAEALLGWSFVPDAQLIVVRGMAVTKHAASPNSAKLLLDYILSAEGQIAFAEGGLTAYRADVAEKAPLHLSQVAAAVGEENLIFSHPAADIADPAKHDDFLAKWKKALKRE